MTQPGAQAQSFPRSDDRRRKQRQQVIFKKHVAMRNSASKGELRDDPQQPTSPTSPDRPKTGISPESSPRGKSAATETQVADHSLTRRMASMHERRLQIKRRGNRDAQTTRRDALVKKLASKKVASHHHHVHTTSTRNGSPNAGAKTTFRGKALVRSPPISERKLNEIGPNVQKNGSKEESKATTQIETPGKESSPSPQTETPGKESSQALRSEETSKKESPPSLQAGTPEKESPPTMQAQTSKKQSSPSPEAEAPEQGSSPAVQAETSEKGSSAGAVAEGSTVKDDIHENHSPLKPQNGATLVDAVEESASDQHEILELCSTRVDQATAQAGQPNRDDLVNGVDDKDDKHSEEENRNGSGQGITTTKGWDTRSVLEFPPDPPDPEEDDPEQPGGESVIDESGPSWDVSKLSFEANENASRPDDALEVFDTASWAATDIAFSGLMDLKPAPDVEDIEKEASRLIDESRKEMRMQDTMGAVEKDGCVLEESNSDKMAMGDLVEDEWDVSKIAFASVAETDTDQKKETGVDMFDTDSWVVGDVTFTSVSVPNLALGPPETFTKENIAAMDPSDNSEISAPPDGTEAKVAPSPGDEEALLDENEARSDVMLEDVKLVLVEDSKLLQKERIENYTSRDFGYISSSDEDDELEDYDALGEDKDGGDDEEVHYVSHDAQHVIEEDIHDIVTENNQRNGDNETTTTVQPESFATFEAAALAAETANLGTAQQPDILASDHASKSPAAHNEPTTASEIINPHGPDSMTSKGAGEQPRERLIPLIPPPPPEKLRKWEEKSVMARIYLSNQTKRESSAERDVAAEGKLDAGVAELQKDGFPFLRQRKHHFDIESPELYGKLAFDAMTDATSDTSASRAVAKAKWKERGRLNSVSPPAKSHEAAKEEVMDILASLSRSTDTNSSRITSKEVPEEEAGPENLTSETEGDSCVNGDLAQGETSAKYFQHTKSSLIRGLPERNLEASPDHTKETGGEARATSPALSEEKPLAPRPKEGGRIIPDIKVAARFAFVSSAAAQKFEEHFSTGNRKQTDSTSDDVFGDSTPNNSILFCGAPDTFLDLTVNSIGQCNPLDVATKVDDTESKERSVTPIPHGVQKSSTPLSRPRSHSVDALLSSGDPHSTGLELVGGAFSTWDDAEFVDLQDESFPGGIDEAAYNRAVDAAATVLSSRKRGEPGKESREITSEAGLWLWVQKDVLERHDVDEENANTVDLLWSLVADHANLDRLCEYVSQKINRTIDLEVNDFEKDVLSPERRKLVPFAVGDGASSNFVVAANFVSFLQRAGKLAGTESPFGDQNPFLMEIIRSRLQGPNDRESDAPVAPVEDLIFRHELGKPLRVVRFLYNTCFEADGMLQKAGIPIQVSSEKERDSSILVPSLPPLKQYQIAPATSPSPFETAVWNNPSLVVILLNFLGDPVAVCRMKMVNQFCNRIIAENEHSVMRDAVRLGGMSPHVRPAFWMWITLEKYGKAGAPLITQTSENAIASQAQHDTSELEKKGREGKWRGVISRDVTRAFGNMPPHKTGARLRTDSIVRALVYWGRGRLMKRGVKGGGEAQPTPSIASSDGQRLKPKPRPSTSPPPWEVGDELSQMSEASQTPTDTVSDWGGVSPVPSFNSSVGDETDKKKTKDNVGKHETAGDRIEKEKRKKKRSRGVEELALSGNTLTSEMKTDLQNQLGFILHALAAAHEDVGYCQGMDYVVAHLLRVLQDTVRWQAKRRTLPDSIRSAPMVAPILESDPIDDEAISRNHVVEETVFQVMDCFLVAYNLRHMYWPELRCLKTCCRVFERIICLKLPVLADHFDHHELNVGLFALGWFQTLFLYLPSMPSATVCHIWDIWLVERSFKIFFRVGTAILFLSQPILLNHDLEGMMTYLNTFPDATLLNPDILIACALQIKVTNRMLVDIERQVTEGY